MLFRQAVDSLRAHLRALETKFDLYLAVMTGVLDEAGARNQLVSVALTEGNAAAEHELILLWPRSAAARGVSYRPLADGHP